MKLTPLDIKKQEFTRTFRGVDAQEVHSFLQMVAEQWDGVLDENRRLEQKVRDLDGKLEHYRKIEEALQEALETARDNSHKTIENAQREAQIILKEARSAAEEHEDGSRPDPNWIESKGSSDDRIVEAVVIDIRVVHRGAEPRRVEGPCRVPVRSNPSLS